MQGPVQVPLRLTRFGLDAPVMGELRPSSNSAIRTSQVGKVDVDRGLPRRKPTKDLVRPGAARSGPTTSSGLPGTTVGNTLLDDRQQELSMYRSIRSPGSAGGGSGNAVATSHHHGSSGPHGAASTTTSSAHGGGHTQLPGPEALLGGPRRGRLDSGGQGHGPLVSAGSGVFSLSNSGNTVDSSGSHGHGHGGATHGAELPKMPKSLEEVVNQDLTHFWKWCPAPIDGLHRCGLLVKLFDYCGLTRKDDKVYKKVWRLDAELRALAVLPTDVVEAGQRISLEAFVHGKRLREAICRCPDVRESWEQQRQASRPWRVGPLSTWVLAVISTAEHDGVLVA